LRPWEIEQRLPASISDFCLQLQRHRSGSCPPAAVEQANALAPQARKIETKPFRSIYITQRLR
jgi:hypothetical protein